ncbi:MAG: hypothetical protein EAZ55_04155 [Cytophagales bacterium]|nr:MAG: hypothetical protein EAZ55_04155 [Cytophagales bacterium]
MENDLPLVAIILIVLGALIVIPLYFMAVVYLIGWLSGWARLANNFRYVGEKPAHLHRFEYIQIGFLGNYNGIINVRATKEGLFLGISLLLFRPNHPDLLIPWANIISVKSTTLTYLLGAKGFEFKVQLNSGGMLKIKIQEKCLRDDISYFQSKIA